MIVAKIYYRNVKDNGYPLEQVPKKWREAVAKMIEADSSKKGRDSDG